MSTAVLHVREHRSVLAGLEKRTLVWLAQRMPARINSDDLTLLGLASMIAAGAAFAAVRLTPWSAAAVIVALAMNWFGDSLDGTLARVRQRQRPRYGFYVDHIVDAFGMIFLVGGLGLSQYMSVAIAMATISLLDSVRQ